MLQRNMVGRQQGFTLIELVIVIVILGILAATGAMAHAKYLVTSPVPVTVTVEGTVVTYSTAFAPGYPKADLGLAAAAGLGASDYTLTAAGTTLTVSPVSAPTAATCSVVYAEPISATTAPDLTVTTTGC